MTVSIFLSIVPCIQNQLIWVKLQQIVRKSLLHTYNLGWRNHPNFLWSKFSLSVILASKSATYGTTWCQISKHKRKNVSIKDMLTLLQKNIRLLYKANQLPTEIWKGKSVYCEFPNQSTSRQSSKQH